MDRERLVETVIPLYFKNIKGKNFNKGDKDRKKRTYK